MLGTGTGTSEVAECVTHPMTTVPPARDKIIESLIGLPPCRSPAAAAGGRQVHRRVRALSHQSAPRPPSFGRLQEYPSAIILSPYTSFRTVTQPSGQRPSSPSSHLSQSVPSPATGCSSRLCSISKSSASTPHEPANKIQTTARTMSLTKVASNVLAVTCARRRCASGAPAG